MRYVFALIATVLSVSVHAGTPQSWAQTPADIYILGEVHDNPAHHARQAQFIRDVAPKAVIYEMLTPEEARNLRDVPRDAPALVEAVTGFHWGNIADYVDVLAASPAQVLGAALPREQVRAAFSQDAATVFGTQAAQYGLTQTVPESELETRKQLQFDAHCEAMPLDMMGGMVEAQRLRDAAFARTTLEALQTYGSPVVLITGNGHARRDWGVPAYLATAAPDVRVLTFGQSEAGQDPDGGFDAIWDAEPVTRPDPCAAFR